MKLKIRQRDKRALLLLFSAAALYVAFSIIVFPSFDRLKEASASAADKEEQLRKYRQAVQRKGHYTELLDEARKYVTEAESKLIQADNASQASIALQNLVEDAAKKVSVEFAQKSVLPAKKRDQYFNEVIMTVSFESTPNQLTSFLSNLRAAPKFVTVRNLQLSPVETATTPPKKGELKKTVRVNVTVGALLSSPEKKG